MEKHFVNKENKHMRNLNILIKKTPYQTMHFHPEIEIILVLQGSPTIIINGTHETYKKDDVIIISAHDSHSIISENENTMLLVLHINPLFFFGYYDHMKDIRFITNLLVTDKKDIFIYTFLTLAKQFLIKEKYYQIACASFINIMIGEILNGCSYYESANSDIIISKEQERVSHIIQYIQSNYYKKISLKNLAEEFNLSTAYLSRFIKNNINQSFSSLLNYIRYINARQLIHEGKYFLVDISVIVGFSDYKYMTRIFRHHLGLSPKEYRDNISDRGNIEELNETTETLNLAETLEVIEKSLAMYGNKVPF